MNLYAANVRHFFLSDKIFLKDFLISLKKTVGSGVYSRTVCHPALDTGSPEKSGGLRVKPAMTAEGFPARGKYK